MKIYIYKIYFSTSKKCYIGQTNNLEGRMMRHLDSKYLVGKALRKYEDWQVSILHTCKSRDEANRVEIEEIRNFNSVTPNGYNLTRGGEGGGSPCKESKEKMRKAQLGRHHSEETIEKRRKANLGQKRTEEAKETKAKIRGYKHTEAAKIKMSIAAIKRYLNKLDTELIQSNSE